MFAATPPTGPMAVAATDRYVYNAVAYQAGDLDADGSDDLAVVESFYEPATRTISWDVVGRQGSTGVVLWRVPIPVIQEGRFSTGWWGLFQDMNADGARDLLAISDGPADDGSSDPDVGHGAYDQIATVLDGRLGKRVWTRQQRARVPSVTNAAGFIERRWMNVDVEDADADGLFDVFLQTLDCAVAGLLHEGTTTVTRVSPWGRASESFDVPVRGTTIPIHAPAGDLTGDGRGDSVEIEPGFFPAPSRLAVRAFDGTVVWRRSFDGWLYATESRRLRAEHLDLGVRVEYHLGAVIPGPHLEALDGATGVRMWSVGDAWSSLDEDLDGDGGADVITLDWDFDTSDIIVVTRSGRDLRVLNSDKVHVDLDPYSVGLEAGCCWGDLDGDGIDDVGVVMGFTRTQGSYWEGDLYALRGADLSLFWTRPMEDPDYEGLPSPLNADLDLDGRDDVWEYSSGRVQVDRGDDLRALGSTPVNSSAAWVTAVDLDPASGIEFVVADVGPKLSAHARNGDEIWAIDYADVA